MTGRVVPSSGASSYTWWHKDVRALYVVPNMHPAAFRLCIYTEYNIHADGKSREPSVPSLQKSESVRLAMGCASRWRSDCGCARYVFALDHSQLWKFYYIHTTNSCIPVYLSVLPSSRILRNLRNIDVKNRNTSSSGAAADDTCAGGNGYLPHLQARPRARR